MRFEYEQLSLGLRQRFEIRLTPHRWRNGRRDHWMFLLFLRFNQDLRKVGNEDRLHPYQSAVNRLEHRRLK